MLKFFYPSIDMGCFNVEIVISWSRYALMKKIQKNPQPKTGDLFHFISKLAVPKREVASIKLAQHSRILNTTLLCSDCLYLKYC